MIWTLHSREILLYTILGMLLVMSWMYIPA
jgi:hypothetical protein